MTLMCLLFGNQYTLHIKLFQTTFLFREKQPNTDGYKYIINK